jgi:hypothetical protein
VSGAAWNWRPSPAAWFERFRLHLKNWNPSPELKLDAGRLRQQLDLAAACGEPWLFHPCMSPITMPETQRLQSDFQLVVWASHHSEVPLGQVQVPIQLGCWRPGDGTAMVSPGSYELAGLVENVREPSTLSEIDPGIELDIWAGTLGGAFPLGIGYPASWCWATSPHLDDVAEQQLKRSTILFLKAALYLRQVLPECAAWAASVTKVVVPLRREPDGALKSGTLATLPGIVFIELSGTVPQTLEALVHESAHLHFIVAEAQAPLVDPEHQGRYSSTLRKDPRPLRGIFLAYHALAHMCALYARLQRDAPELKNELTCLTQMRDASARTLLENRHHLTRDGELFLERTMETSHDAAA